MKEKKKEKRENEIIERKRKGKMIDEDEGKEERKRENEIIERKRKGKMRKKEKGKKGEW